MFCCPPPLPIQIWIYWQLGRAVRSVRYEIMFGYHGLLTQQQTASTIGTEEEEATGRRQGTIRLPAHTEI